MTDSVSLLVITGGLVLLGCVLYVADAVGWAQLFWVLASGTAGGAVVLIVEKR